MNISAVVDVAALRDYVRTLPNVEHAAIAKYMCADPGQKEIRDAIYEHSLNRVVIASCTPRLHEPTFRKTLQEAKLNHYLLEMVNIREQCSWVHMEDPEGATAKAKDLVKAGVDRVRFQSAQVENEEPVEDAALVIGAGIAGINAALEIADGGHSVILVEKEAHIGGNMAKLGKVYPSMDCST